MEYMSTEIRSAREAHTLFKILGIKEITTDRQRKNGTIVYELPISQVWQTLNPKPLRFAIYETGYIRNVTEGLASPYQINKVKVRKHDIRNGYAYDTKERILIHSWEERIIYLAKFIIKNYYHKPTYMMSDYVMKCLREAYLEQNKTGFSDGLGFVNSLSIGDVEVIINGHRYNIC